MRSRAGPWSTASRRLVLLFLLVLVPPAAALTVLGLLVLEQDRRLIAERNRERAEAASDAVVRALADAIAQARSRLRAGDTLEGAALLRVDGDRLVAQPAAALPWTPTPLRLQAADRAAFDSAELEEFQKRGDRGRRVYERLSLSPVASVRAGALLRLARLHRNEGRTDAALAAYADLARITSVAFDGMPADLLARRATCDLLARARRNAALTTCAGAVADDLVAGRWSLDRASWQVSADQVGAWTASSLDIAPDRRAIADAAAWFWRESRRADGSPDARNGWQLLESTGGVTTLELSGDSSTRTALVVTPGALARWIDAARLVGQRQGTHVAIGSPSGRPIVGTPPPAAAQAALVTRTGTQSGLPWDIQVWTQSDGSASETRARRWTMAGGLASVVLLVAGGGVLIWRVVQRELAVAARQTDFVATVSHEFRTPLASLRHVAELLDEDDALPGDRRRALYDVIGRSATRLSGLVDTLLDFTRIESGRQPSVRQPLDAGEFARTVIDDFVRQVDDEQVHVAWHAEDDLIIDADADALGRALSNLLDNAAKYGPRPCHIAVSVLRAGLDVHVEVRDDGPGIPLVEQAQLFEKFVRGSDATQRGIRGTGLGLAIVSHVARAHGGTATVESRPGQGSLFRITMPNAAVAATWAVETGQAVRVATGTSRGEPAP